MLFKEFPKVTDTIVINDVIDKRYPYLSSDNVVAINGKTTICKVKRGSAVATIFSIISHKILYFFIMLIIFVFHAAYHVNKEQ